MKIKRGSECLKTETDITEDEAALYDRQIRLWGIESQKRLRHSKILIIGMGGLGCEVAKNIALAGVKSIFLLDDKEVGYEDITAQFFLVGADPQKIRAEASVSGISELNPNVEVVYEPQYIEDKPDEYYSQFSVVCCTDCSIKHLLKLNKICRENNVKFVCGDVWGQHGYCFADFGKFSFMNPLPTKSSEEEEEGTPAKTRRTETALQAVEFCSLEKALSVKRGKMGTGLLHKRTSKILFLLHILLEFKEMHGRYPSANHRNEDIEALKKMQKSVMSKLGFDEDKISDEMFSNVFGELSPVCAVVGGILAQEIIKAICADQMPLRNFFFFNGDDCSGVAEYIGPKNVNDD